MTIDTWTARNQRTLIAEIAVLEHVLAGRDAAEARAVLETERAGLERLSTIDALCETFGLSGFERGVVLACLGGELLSTIGEVFVAIGGAPYPTFRALLATHPDAHFSATASHAPLRNLRLIELRAGDDLLQSRLRLDERILQFLLGVPVFDAALRGVLEPLDHDPDIVLPAPHLALVKRLLAAWSSERRTVPQLCGADQAAATSVVAHAAAQIGLSVVRVRAADLPSSAAERDALRRLWEREAMLGRHILLVEHDLADPPEAARTAASFVARLRGGVVIVARDPLPLPGQASTRIEIDPLVADDQAVVWQRELGLPASEVESELGAVMAQFRLGVTALRSAAADVRERLRDADPDPVGVLAWRACREQARPHLDGLAQRIVTSASWDDLVLPPAKVELLQAISAHVRHARTVYDRWGFGGRGVRGLGVTALFAGSSGTGKTLAAEVLANELELDLYKIDLSQVVSKFIGETEKNLRRIFDGAEECGALLLFDEADALFGKRSEVKDSHDRYANLEVSYLLQRMEQYRGLAVLTTNMRRSLDGAFLRRLRFVIEFPFPDVPQRAEIWRRAFPEATPTEALDHDRLARLNIAGGVIRSIALNAAFLAAHAGVPVDMQHVNRAARDEYQKLEKPYDGVL